MITISFVNMKGGVAKTTLAVNVADCISRRKNKKVLLIDIDPQFNATQCVMSPEEYSKRLQEGIDTIVNVFDDTPRVIAGTVSGPEILQPKNLEDVEPIALSNKLHILPGDIQLYRLEMAPGEGREYRLKRFLESVSETYDYAIIDTPPTPSVWMSTALIASNYFVVPCKPEPLSSTGIDLLKMVVKNKGENYGLNIHCAGLVLTIAEKNTIVYREAIAFIDTDPFWKGKRYKYELVKRTEVARLQGSQRMILDCSDPALKTSLVRITDELIARTANA